MESITTYGITQESLDEIMAKSPDKMTEPEKEIWRKEVLARCAATTKRCNETLAKSHETKKIMEDTEASSKRLEDKWQEFQDTFKRTMQAIVGKIGEGIGTLVDVNQMDQIKELSKFSPKKMTALKAGKLLKNKKNVVILTGAGLSAASGIPTFRGNDGLWTKKYKNCTKPEDIATLSYFNQWPDQKWEWMYDFTELVEKSKPNGGHLAICQFQEYCFQNDIKCTLITQNIDDLHCRVMKKSKVFKSKSLEEGSKGYGFTDNVLEIHGNIRYMRCHKECSKDLYPIPPKSTL